MPGADLLTPPPPPLVAEDYAEALQMDQHMQQVSRGSKSKKVGRSVWQRRLDVDMFLSPYAMPEGASAVKSA